MGFFCGVAAALLCGALVLCCSDGRAFAESRADNPVVTQTASEATTASNVDTERLIPIPLSPNASSLLRAATVDELPACDSHRFLYGKNGGPGALTSPKTVIYTLRLVSKSACSMLDRRASTTLGVDFHAEFAAACDPSRASNERFQLRHFVNAALAQERRI